MKKPQGNAAKSGSHEAPAAFRGEQEFGRVEAQRPVAPALRREQERFTARAAARSRRFRGRPDAADQDPGDGLVIAFGVAVHAADALIEAADQARQIALGHDVRSSSNSQVVVARCASWVHSARASVQPSSPSPRCSIGVVIGQSRGLNSVIVFVLSRARGIAPRPAC